MSGAGDAFCSGADLSGTADSVERLHALHHMRNIGETVFALAQLQQPVIAKVNGDAIGAGMNLALGCDAFVDDIAARLAVGPPIALGLTKRLLNEAKDVMLAEAVEHEAMAQAVNGATTDMQNAILAFREKRNPTFEGR